EETKGKDRSLWVYLGITFALTYLYEIFVVGGLIGNQNFAPVISLLISLAMFFPTVGMLLTRLVTKEGFKNLWLAPNLRGNMRHYLAAWLLPAAAIAVGAVVYFVIFPTQFDLNMGYMATMYAAQGMPFDPAATRILILTQILTGLFLAPLLNAVTCLGEEWGWRGYMMPKLAARMSFGKACLLGGVIWGLWHAPLTMMGHNYGMGYWGFPVTGIAAMCLFCVTVGTLLSYLSLKVKSCWPAVIGHAVLNGLAAAAIYFTPGTASPTAMLLGPAPTGIVGGVGFLALAITAVLLSRKQNSEAVQPATPELP
ncbi:MAG: CPBP family intramembrane glutamic endopeptidase, partial [Angelakisella sp.]